MKARSQCPKFSDLLKCLCKISQLPVAGGIGQTRDGTLGPWKPLAESTRLQNFDQCLLIPLLLTSVSRSYDKITRTNRLNYGDSNVHTDRLNSAMTYQLLS